MEKTKQIIVKEVSIRTLKVDGEDFISITDIAKQKNPVEPKDVVKTGCGSKTPENTGQRHLKAKLSKS